MNFLKRSRNASLSFSVIRVFKVGKEEEEGDEGDEDDGCKEGDGPVILLLTEVGVVDVGLLLLLEEEVVVPKLLHKYKYINKNTKKRQKNRPNVRESLPNNFFQPTRDFV